MIDIILRRAHVAPVPGEPVDIVLGEEGDDSGGALPALAAAVIAAEASSAGRAMARTAAAWHTAGALAAAAIARWATPGRLAGQAQAPWAPSSAAAALGTSRAVWAAQQLAAGAARALWGPSAPVDGHARLPWDAGWLRQRAVVLPWQAALQRTHQVTAAWARARYSSTNRRMPWALGLLIPSHGSPLPVAKVPGGTVPRPRPADVYLCCPAELSSTDVVLGHDCCAGDGVGYIGAGASIASRRSYVHTHSLAAWRLPDMTPLTLYSLGLETDRDSAVWTCQATGPADLLTALAPAGGVPKAVRIELDGMAWELVIDGLRRERRFGNTAATFTARSPTILLGAPYLPTRAWLNAAPATAAQLVEEALAFSGATVAWGIPDWTVPAGAWSFTGTPLQAVREVVDAARAVLVSPRAGTELLVRPRYQVAPWDWATAEPDVLLPLDVVETEGYERRDQPAYEGVYLAGMAQGVRALVKRTGSAPASDLTLPLVTHALYTDLAVCGHAGTAMLAAGGPQVDMQLSLPVLTGPGEPGVIDPGQLVAVSDPAGAWRGLSTSVRVTVATDTDGRIQVRQAVGIERHL